MRTYRNGAKAFRKSKLPQVKQLLNQESRAQANPNGKAQPETLQTILKTENKTPNLPAVTKAVADEVEEKRKRIYATSITNTLTNCEVFLAIIDGFGADYNTNETRLTKPELDNTLGAAKALVLTLAEAEADYNYAMTARKLAFKGLEALASLVCVEMAIAGAPEETLSQLQTLLRLMRGERKVAKNPNDPNAKYISASHTNFDDKAANFNKFVIMVGEFPDYNPTREPLKFVNLEALNANLQAANTAVIVAKSQAKVARIKRNDAFNTPVLGLCDTFDKAKDVVLICFGRNSEQYRSVRGLKFRKIRAR